MQTQGIESLDCVDMVPLHDANRPNLGGQTVAATLLVHVEYDSPTLRGDELHRFAQLFRTVAVACPEYF